MMENLKINSHANKLRRIPILRDGFSYGEAEEKEKGKLAP